MSKCKICRAEFVKRSMTHKCCSPECAIEHAQRERNRKTMREIREKRQAMKPMRQLVKEAQAAFNAFVRARDAGRLCICCDRPLVSAEVGGGFDCGHYRSVGSAPHLRFDERNAHGQTKYCNRHRAGNAADYRIGLIKRIGISEVEALEADQAQKKWTREQLIEIAKTYRAKAREIQEERKAA